MILSTAKHDDVWYAAVTDKKGRLVACSFSKHKRAAEVSVINSVARTFGSGLASSPRKSQVVNVLHRIYSGRNYGKLPRVLFLTPSDFLRRVYKATMRIPKGKVTTYGRLAQLAGSRRLSRAVGNAMARNPLPLIVPCHRVVPSTLRVGNYGVPGAKKGGGSRVKRGLLIREGVEFEGERILPRCVWGPVLR